LMCAVPVGMRRAICSPVPMSAVIMLRSSPYLLSDARSTASPGVANGMTGATGPKTSLSYAGVPGPARRPGPRPLGEVAEPVVADGQVALPLGVGGVGGGPGLDVAVNGLVKLPGGV
jgi:hypothetical protein